MLGDLALLEGKSPGRATMTAVDDNEVIREFLETGDGESFGKLVDPYKHRVLRLVSSVLGPRLNRDAEDVVQDSLVRVYKNLSRFRAESKFSTWLFRIAYNTAVDHRRKLARQSQLTDAERVSGATKGTSKLPAAERLEILAGVERLPDPYRTAIYLHYWHGSSLAEIGEFLGARPNTVKSYLFRGRQRLHKILTGEAKR